MRKLTGSTRSNGDAALGPPRASTRFERNVKALTHTGTPSVPHSCQPITSFREPIT